MQFSEIFFTYEQVQEGLYYLHFFYFSLIGLLLAFPIFALTSVITSAELRGRAKFGWLFLLFTTGPLAALGYSQTIEKRSLVKFFGTVLFFFFFVGAGAALFLGNYWHGKSQEKFQAVLTGAIAVNPQVAEGKRKVFLSASRQLNQRMIELSLFSPTDLLLLARTISLQAQTLLDKDINQTEADRWHALAADTRTFSELLQHSLSDPFPATPVPVSTAPAAAPVAPAAGAPPSAGATPVSSPMAPANGPGAGDPLAAPVVIPGAQAPAGAAAPSIVALTAPPVLLVDPKLLPARYQDCDSGAALKWGEIACWGWKRRDACNIKEARICKAAALTRPPNGACTVPAKRCPGGMAGAVAKQKMGKDEKCLEAIWEYACL